MSKQCFAGFLLCVIAAGSAVAQIRQPPTDASIRGKVFLSSGRTAERVEVRLERSEMQMVSSTYTDSIGNFEFRGLPIGAYYVVVRLDGYDEVRQLVDMTALGRNGATVTIQLTNRITLGDSKAGDGDDVVDITDLQRNYPKKAVQEYQKAVEENQKGNTARAIQHMEEAIKLAPDFYQAHNNLGVFYQRMERYEDAAKEYKEARELNPRASEPLVNMGSLFIQESDSHRNEGDVIVGRILDDALDILEEAVKMDPRSAVGYYYLGSAYYKSDFFAEAEQNLLRSQRLDPKSKGVRLMLINVYMKTGKWEDVLAQLNAYISENPKASDRAQMEQMRAKVVEGLQAIKK
jgi:tetratricopeptide (TPR) repeat protein